MLPFSRCGWRITPYWTLRRFKYVAFSFFIDSSILVDRSFLPIKNAADRFYSKRFAFLSFFFLLFYSLPYKRDSSVRFNWSIVFVDNYGATNDSFSLSSNCVRTRRNSWTREWSRGTLFEPRNRNLFYFLLRIHARMVASERVNGITFPRIRRYPRRSSAARVRSEISFWFFGDGLRGLVLAIAPTVRCAGIKS